MKLIWKHHAALLLSLVLGACVQPPAAPIEPASPELAGFLGQLDITIDAAGATTGVQFQPQLHVAGSGLKFLPGLTENFLATDGNRYVNANFGVQNLTGANLRNLSLVAYHKTGNLSGTGISSITDAAGQAVELEARMVVPTHGMNTNATVNVQKAHLQLFRESELLQFKGQLPSPLASGEYLLGYGYQVKNTGGGPTVSGIGPSRLTNRVTLGFMVPPTSATTNKYALSYLLFTEASDTVVQSPQETTTVGGQLQTSVNITSAPKVKVLRNSSYTAANRRTVCAIRIAGDNVAIPAPLYLDSIAGLSATDLLFCQYGLRDTFYFTPANTPLVVSTPGLAQNEADILPPAITITALTTPSNGSVMINSNGGFTYTPTQGFSGTDQFTYKATINGVDISPLTAFITVGTKRISAGEYHACQIKPNGKAYCWGADINGRLGNGAITGSQASPSLVDTTGIAGFIGWKIISAGEGSTCGIIQDGRAYCWGNDGDGELGNGAITGNQASPSLVDTTGIAGFIGWLDISTNDNLTCGIIQDGRGYCWGADSDGKLGNGAITGSKNAPSLIDTTGIPGFVAWSQVYTGEDFACGIVKDGRAYCWGDDGVGQLGNGAIIGDRASPSLVDTTAIPGFAAWKIIDTGGDDVEHVCGIIQDGRGYCWGADFDGQLGNGAITGDQASPSLVDTSGISGFIAWQSIAAGEESSCGIIQDGRGYCWGKDSNGELGNGTTITGDQVSPSPIDTTAIPGGSWDAVAVGDEMACGILRTGPSYCWGWDDDGKVGNGGGMNSFFYSPELVNFVP
jgi:alpha-tubulin suppressor-like RCC1 family protein